MELIAKQYTLLKETREVLFAYLETMPEKDFIKDVENFGRGNIRTTQLHVANTYRYWIGNFSLNKNLTSPNDDSVTNVDKMRKEFLGINKLVEEFVEKFYNEPLDPITNTLSNKKEISLTPLALITHAMTHEFHHKGQMVSMGRILGYPPPDTDLIRTS